MAQLTKQEQQALFYADDDDIPLLRMDRREQHREQHFRPRDREDERMSNRNKGRQKEG